MKKSEKVLLIILGVLVVICLGVFFIFKNNDKNNNDKNNLVLDGDYVFVTNMGNKTMMNDGGSHTDIYYDVDLKNNKVVKKQDTYRGFEGKVSEDVLNTYLIDEVQKEKIKEIFNKIIEDKDKEDSSKTDYLAYYFLKTSDGFEIKTSNYDLINEFEDMFLNSDTKYIKYKFITDMVDKTMLDDGGTHTDIYYEVNLRNNVVVKKKDEYKGFEGKVSEEVLRTYAINDYQNGKIKNIFDKIIEEKDKEIDYSKTDRFPYTLKTSDGLSILTYNFDLIDEFEMYFDR